MLSSLEDCELSDYERVVVLRAHQRMVSHYQARVYADMAAVHESYQQLEDLEDDLCFEGAASEIRAALRLTRRSAEFDLSLALGLFGRLPRVGEALLSGEIDPRRARVMIDATSHLSEEAAREVTGQVMERAGRLTTGQLSALLGRLSISADPDEAKTRYHHSLEERRVVGEETGRGTGNLLGLEPPPERVNQILSRLTEIAQGLKTSGEERSLDQLRADVFLDLLEGKGSHLYGRRGVINLTVDPETLSGLSEAPGELAGFGPVIAEIARKVAEEQVEAEWRYLVSHPQTGLLVHHGRLRRRPSSSQRREVEARNPTCVFPGCRAPASSCDLDHRIPFSEGGPTDPEHLAPACRHDHVIRHRTRWRHRPLPGGDHLWISPLGHRYTTSGRRPP
jgi:hypothetical protein